MSRVRNTQRLAYVPHGLTHEEGHSDEHGGGAGDDKKETEKHGAGATLPSFGDMAQKAMSNLVGDV